MFWSRHTIMTFSEPSLAFKRYPLDVQNISLVLQSYAFDSNFVRLVQYPNVLSFNLDKQTQQSYVDENQMWFYDTYSCYTVLENLGSPLNPLRSYYTTYLNIRLARKSYGVLCRLALPITIFMIVVGLSFFAKAESRIYIAMEVLFLMATFFVIVGDTIPLVGYLSWFDQFAITCFSLLTVAITVHFSTVLLGDSSVSLPMNRFFKALIEAIFRLIWIPLSMIMLVVYFEIHSMNIRAAMYFVCVVSLLNSLGNLKSLKFEFLCSIILLYMKQERLLKEAPKPSDEPFETECLKTSQAEVDQMNSSNPPDEEEPDKLLNTFPAGSDLDSHSPNDSRLLARLTKWRPKRINSSSYFSEGDLSDRASAKEASTIGEGDHSCEVILGRSNSQFELSNRGISSKVISDGGNNVNDSLTKLPRRNSFIKTEKHLGKLKHSVSSRQEQHAHSSSDSAFKKRSRSEGRKLDDVNLLVKADKLTKFEQLMIRFVGWWLQVDSLADLQRSIYGESDQDDLA